MGRLILFLLLLILLLIAGLITLAIVAVQQWGLAGLAGVVVAFIVAGFVLKRLAGMAVERLFRAPFKMKGAVLRGARATVHSVLPVDAPPARQLADDEDDEGDEDESEQPAEALDWFQIEATITPAATAGATPFQHWEIGELLLTVPGAPEEPDEEPEYSLDDLHIFMEGEFKPDEGYKMPGEQRLRFRVGVPPGTERLIFRYYFELFGEVRFPRRVSA
jgi:hypothetical protein